MKGTNLKTIPYISIDTFFKLKKNPKTKRIYTIVTAVVILPEVGYFGLRFGQRALSVI